MKRFLAIMLVLTLFISVVPATSMAASEYATVTGGWLRLRAQGNFDSDTINSYYTGTVVEILSTSGSWYRVKTPDGKTGYMYNTYLKLGSSGWDGTTADGSAVVVSHNGYGVRLRKGPGTGYRIIKVYPVGTGATVIQRGSQWTKISINGTVGYMMNQFLNFGGGGDVPGSGDVVCNATIWSRNGYGVRLRTGPGTNYSKIGVYSVGTRVEVLKKGSVWDIIRVGSRVGYMMNDFLNYYDTNKIASVGLNNSNPIVGSVLQAYGLSPSQATVSYSWLADGVECGTTSTYTVSQSDVGKKIQLKVTGTGSYTGSATSALSNVVVSNTQITKVEMSSITPVVGEKLTATVTPTDAKVIYAWKVDGKQVSNEATYTVKDTDLGKKIQLIVTGTGVFSGTASTIESAAVATQGKVSSVNIYNNNTSANANAESPNAGDVLSVKVFPAAATVDYAWTVDGTTVGTAATLTVKSEWAGKTIKLTVKGNGSYVGEATDTTKAVTNLAIITDTAIVGVAAPEAGKDLVKSFTAAQYTGVVAWEPNTETFKPGLEYTAIITLTPTGTYSFAGVAANAFTVAGVPATNEAGKGIVTAKFAKLEKQTLDKLTIAGLVAPVKGNPAVPSIAGTTQYKGMDITWTPAVTDVFLADQAYTAEFNLVVKGDSYILADNPQITVEGVTANDQMSYDAATGKITVTFAKTAAEATEPTDPTVDKNIKITDISAPVTGATGTASINAGTLYKAAAIQWRDGDADISTAFEAEKVYTAVFKLELLDGSPIDASYTVTVDGSTSATMYEGGYVIAVFPATAVDDPDTDDPGTDDPTALENIDVNLAGITTPVTGASDNSTMGASSDYAVLGSWWKPELVDGKFAADTDYVLHILLGATEGNDIDENTQINVTTGASSWNKWFDPDKHQVSISLVFNKTDDSEEKVNSTEETEVMTMNNLIAPIPPAPIVEDTEQTDGDDWQEPSNEELIQTQQMVTEPEYVEPEYVEPEYVEPEYVEPKNEEPTYTAPEPSEPIEVKLDKGRVNVDYYYDLSSAGYLNASMDIDVERLPDGLKLKNNIISGTPTKDGKFKTIMSVTDLQGNACEIEITISIREAKQEGKTNDKQETKVDETYVGSTTDEFFDDTYVDPNADFGDGW